MPDYYRLADRLLAHLAADGQVSTRSIDRYANAADASHFHLLPAVVVRARDAADVGRVFAEASRVGASLTLRSGGTSLSGQASGDGVLLDVRRGFRRIEVLDDGLRVRVQPGATVRAVNTKLTRSRRKLGPDPASEIACTVGGVVANNSSGMACGIAENSYCTIESLVYVLPSGTIVDSAAPGATARLRAVEPDLVAGIEVLRDRVRGDERSVSRIRAQYAIKNTMGYGINAFLDHEDPVAILTRLMIGSEGTLGFVAEATFRTVPIRPAVATSLLIFDSVHAATDALPALIASGAATLELMDATSLRVARTDPAAPAAVCGFDLDRHAALLVEYQADTDDALAAAGVDFDRIVSELGMHDSARLTRDGDTRAALWHMRKGLYAQVAGARASGTTALLEDIAVPVAALSATCDRLTALFEQYGYRDSVLFGHAKDGNIHFMLTDRFDEGGLERYAAFTDDMVSVVLDAGGSLKAEHGTGRVMAPFVRMQFGDELYGVMQDLKALVDPTGMMNPGVLIADDPSTHLRDIKQTPRIEPEADRCVDCGYCEPVCPSRDLTLTPRQRITVDRAMHAARARGEGALADELAADYSYDAVQTCAVDGMCQTNCPVSINTGDLMKRFRKDTHPALERAVWDTAAKYWGATTGAASAALSVAKRLPAPLITVPNSLARAVVGAERLPMWTPDLPGGGAARREPSPGGTVDAVYLPACIGRMFGPSNAGDPVRSSLLRLAARAGATLRIPDDVESLCCGTPWTSKGMPGGASVVRDRTVEALRRATDGGAVPVICDASSCTEGLIHAVEEAGAFAITVIDAVEFVATTLMPRLPTPRPVDRLVLHPTCSSTRLGFNSALGSIASFVAHYVDVPDDWGCCAFAGDRGMLHAEITASATALEAAAVRSIPADAHASCSRTCEIGMTRATGRDYVHVLTLLDQVTAPID